MKIIVLVLGVLASSGGWAAQSFFEANHLVRMNTAQTDMLLVKLRNSVAPDATLNFSFHVGFEVEPVFLRGAETYRKERAKLRAMGKLVPHLENYHYLIFDRALTPLEAEYVLEQAYDNRDVQYAYFEPKIKDAQVHAVKSKTNGVAAAPPDFQGKQFYLGAPPSGVNASTYAWSVPGGTGKGIRLIDVETGFYPHDDLPKPFWEGPLNGKRDHGVAVLGVILAKKNGFGVTGIAHDATFGFTGTRYKGNWTEYRKTVVRALEGAASQLNPGEIIVLEQHCPGPDKGRFVAPEYYKAIFDVIKLATDRGVHVIAAAGNGGSNFDLPVYNGAFDLSKRDSGAILVGAVGSPGSSNHMQRLGFSNYGTRIDASGYGRKVVSTGYGTLYRGKGRHEYYTNVFGGTSSATPIVVGSVASILGMAKVAGKVVTPKEIRAALRGTGSAQQGDLKQRVGSLPDIKALHAHFNEFKTTLAGALNSICPPGAEGLCIAF